MILLQASAGDEFFSIASDTVMYATAFAAIFAAFRIYRQWQNGEPIIGAIFTWIGGIIIATSLMWGVKVLIKGGMGRNNSIKAQAVGLARDGYSMTVVLGVVVALISIVDIYWKYQKGEDVVDLIFKWVGSIFFLFTFGYVIEYIMN